MIVGLSSLAALGKKKDEAPAPPPQFLQAPGALPKWLPWVLGVVGTGVVIFLWVKTRNKAEPEQPEIPHIEEE
jgi:hypothetical protein